ncbi:MAG: type II secretion system F family protein [Verrucomicrobiota bacterium]
MALLTNPATNRSTKSGLASGAGGKTKVSFAESQRLAKLKAYEKKAKSKKVKLENLAIFTEQLASMLEAGLPLVTALEALQDQTEDPVFAIVIRDVRNDVSSGTAFSEACAKFPKAFPNLFLSMSEAGEASGGLAEILAKTAIYFNDSVKLSKQVKSAMTYPTAVITLAIGLVTVLLVKVIPVFAEMFQGFGAELPKPTQFVIDISEFLGSYILYILAGMFLFYVVISKFFSTPKGRVIRDNLVMRIPVLGELNRKINLSRFCRTYSILLRSGVPILRSLEIVSRASNNVFVENACTQISRNISQGGQVSETIAAIPYFPPMLKHMSKAGEQTGNIDGMMNKVSDFYDNEIETLVSALTSLMEPLLIVFLGVVIGGIVMAMFMPIFELSSVVGG